MAIALIASTKVTGTGQTSPAIDTTGATLLVFTVNWFQGSPATRTVSVSDNKSNTWVKFAEYSATASAPACTIFYATNVSGKVGPGHTFTPTGTSGVAEASFIYAFSGVHPTAPQDQQSTGTSTSSTVTSIQPGSVTPTENDEVLVADLGEDGAITNLAIDSSFIGLQTIAYQAGSNEGGGAAYKIQTAAGAENPTWSWTTARKAVTAIATFKAGAVANAPRSFASLY